MGTKEQTNVGDMQFHFQPISANRTANGQAAFCCSIFTSSGTVRGGGVCVCVWECKVGRRIPVSCSSFSGTQNDLLPEIHKMLSCSGKDDKSFLSPCVLCYN